MDPTLYDLLMAEDEPGAAAQAQALSGNIQRERVLGMLGQLTGDKVLSGFGGQLAAGADRRAAAMAEAPGARLRQLLDKQRLAGTQAEMDDANAVANSVYHDLARKFGTALPKGTTNRQAKEMLGLAERAYGAEQRAEENRMNREAMRGSKEEKEIDKQVELLSKRTEGTPTLRNDLATLDAAATAKDIPAVGPLDGLKPDWMLSDDGTKVRQAALGTVGMLLKLQSGQTVSKEEATKKLRELGMGPTSTEAQFKAGLARLRQQVADELRNKEAGAKPEAVQEAARRGMVTSEEIRPRGRGAPPADRDSAAVKWARENPDDPRAAKILQLNGAQ